MQEISYETCEKILKEEHEKLRISKDKNYKDIVEFLSEIETDEESDSGLEGYSRDLVERLYNGVNQINRPETYNVVEAFKYGIINSVDNNLAISITEHSALCAHRLIDTGYPMDSKEYDDVVKSYAQAALMIRKTLMTEFIAAWTRLIDMRIAQIKGE